MNIFGNVSFWGSQFSPLKAQSEIGITFTKQNEVGENGSTGKFNLKPYDYGAASIDFECADTTDSYLVPKEIIQLLKLHKDTLTGLGVEDIVVTINVSYSGQCNVEFDPAFMRAVADLGLPLVMTCFQNPDAGKKGKKL